MKNAGKSGKKLSARDRAYLATYDASRFERPSLTVDVVLLTLGDDGLSTLLVRRSEPPFQGRFALPGGFVGLTEGLEEAAARVLATKCGLGDVFVEQLYTFGRADRDPRTRVVSVAYYALVDAATFARGRAAVRSPRADKGHEAMEVVRVRVRAPSRETPADACEVDVCDAEGIRIETAFDHEEIVTAAVRRLRGKLDYAPVGYALLPERFTLLELQRVHETVLGCAVNKDSFRRRMLASGDLVALGEHQANVGHRPAELYRFARRSAL